MKTRLQTLIFRFLCVALAAAAALTLSFCSGDDSPEAGDVSELEDAPRQICEKMVGCMEEWSADLPEQQREMMRNMFTGDACTQRLTGIIPGTTGSDPNATPPSPEEIARAVSCVNRMMAATCDELKENPNFPECQPQ